LVLSSTSRERMPDEPESPVNGDLSGHWGSALGPPYAGRLTTTGRPPTTIRRVLFQILKTGIWTS
jgi:hypothetical protein